MGMDMERMDRLLTEAKLSGKAEDIILKIQGDLQRRAGFDGVWDSLDEATKKEILNVWFDLVMAELLK